MRPGPGARDNAVIYVLKSFLRQSLRGYPEYAAEVRFRLIPGLW